MCVVMNGGERILRLTVSGPPGSGTSTLVGKLCEDRGWSSVNGGDIFRKEASNRGLNVVEFSALCKQDLEVDRSLDTIVRSAMSDPEGPEVVESRLCGWWAQELGLQCPRVWVSVSDEERARRIQNREGGDYRTCLELSKKRQSDDMDRYRELYGIDLDDMSPYTLVVDADELDAEEVFGVVSTVLG